MASWTGCILRRAWADSAAWGQPKWRFVMVNGLIAAVGAIFGGTVTEWGELRGPVVGAMVGAIIVPIGFLVLMAILAPRRIWRDDQETISRLEKQVRPKLILHPPPRGEQTVVGRHLAIDSDTGKNMFVTYVRLLIRNPAPYLAHGCRAYISNLELLDPDGMPNRSFVYSDPIHLCRAYAWGQERFDIEPHGRRYVDVFHTRSDGRTVLADPEGMLKYRDLFDRESGIWYFTVTVFAPQDLPAQSACFSVVLDAGRVKVRCGVAAEGQDDDAGVWEQDITAGSAGPLQRPSISTAGPKALKGTIQNV